MDLVRSARLLLLADDGPSSTAQAMAERAARAFEQLSAHLAAIIGTNGVTTVLVRSIRLSVRDYGWLGDAKVAVSDDARVYEALQRVFAQQSPEMVVEGFVAVLSTFIALLGRLIGDSLVWRLVEEVWPAIFPDDKETS